MDNIVLKLFDYVSGTCPYRGCEHNIDGGLCGANNIEHLDYIARMIDYSLNKNTGVLKNNNIVCSQLSVKDGYCEKCNSKLKEIHEPHPYGNSNAIEVFYECINPKCK